MRDNLTYFYTNVNKNLEITHQSLFDIPKILIIPANSDRISQQVYLLFPDRLLQS